MPLPRTLMLKLSTLGCDSRLGVGHPSEHPRSFKCFFKAGPGFPLPRALFLLRNPRWRSLAEFDDTLTRLADFNLSTAPFFRSRLIYFVALCVHIEDCAVLPLPF